MSFRVGTFILTPTVFFLPMALAFFFVVSFQRLHPGVLPSRRQAGLALAGAAIAGVVGAWANGVLGAGQHLDPLHSWLALRFGSFGGYWGALAGAMACAALVRTSPMRVADALVPGLLIGGSVARLGCLFTGCCRGIWIGPIPGAGFQPFRPWPVYDIAALLLTLAVILVVSRKHRKGQTPGLSLCLLLTVYGVLRFMLEFLRDLDPLLFRLTAGQMTACLQVAVGIALFARLRQQTCRADISPADPV